MDFSEDEMRKKKKTKFHEYEIEFSDKLPFRNAVHFPFSIMGL